MYKTVFKSSRQNGWPMEW